MRDLIRPDASFTPRELFARMQGAWFEPRPGYMWQENTGATATTTVGQSVGLILGLDQQQRLASEIIVDGQFANAAASWVLSPGVTANVGSMTLPNTTSYTESIFQSNGVFSANSVYQLQINGTGTVGYRTGTSDVITVITLPFSGIFSRAAYANRRVQILNVAGSAATVTGVSCKQILGNHASQSTAANRPTLQYNGNLPLIRHADSTDVLAAAMPAINVRRNLLTWSENFSFTDYKNNNCTVEPNVALAPDGTVTADKITVNTTGTTTTYRAYLNVPSSTLTFSVYAKAGSSPTAFNIFGAYNITTSTNLAIAYVNLTTGVISYINGSSGITAQLLWNGWVRISVNPTSNIASGNNILFYYGGNGASQTGGIFGYRWGAQLEVGSVATDYQKITDWTSEAYSSSGSIYFATPQGMSCLHNQSIGTSYNLPALQTDNYCTVITPARLAPPLEKRLELYMLRLAGLIEPDYLLDDNNQQLTDDSGELLLRA